MPVDPTTALARYDRMMDELRSACVPLRDEATNWLRDFFKKRKRSRTAIRFTIEVHGIDYPPLSWWCRWDGGGMGRYDVFNPTSSVPPLPSDAEMASLGLDPGWATGPRNNALWDTAVDAWVAAGGPAFGLPLYTVGLLVNGPDYTGLWHTKVRDAISQKESDGARQRKSSLHPPFAPQAPAVPAGLIARVRRGDADALAEWAGAFETAGESRTASLLRWLPEWYERIGPDVRAREPGTEFQLSTSNRGSAWWIGDAEYDAPEGDTVNLGLLLAGWNVLHPAVEWFCRQFDLPFAQLAHVHRRTGREEHLGVFLRSGEHFGPIDPDGAVVSLRLEEE